MSEKKPERRKVEVYEHKIAIGTGIFYEFGCNFEVFDNGAGNYSTAIVEMPDGSIKNVPVENIVFNN